MQMELYLNRLDTGFSKHGRVVLANFFSCSISSLIVIIEKFSIPTEITGDNMSLVLSLPFQPFITLGL